METDLVSFSRAAIAIAVLIKRNRAQGKKTRVWVKQWVTRKQHWSQYQAPTQRLKNQKTFLTNVKEVKERLQLDCRGIYIPEKPPKISPGTM